MSGGSWLCKRCFDLDGEALEEHIRAHARATRWSYDEIKQATTELRAVADHCPDCKLKVMGDVVQRDLLVFDETHMFSNHDSGRATDYNAVPRVPVTMFYSGRRTGKTTMMEQFEEFQRSLEAAFAEVKKVFEPFARHMLPEVKELSARERALEARKNRNTGPARPSGPSAKRPRRHK